MKWTLDEDVALLSLVRRHFTSLVTQKQLDATMPFSQMLHAEFSSLRHTADALLFRLKEAKILSFASCPGRDKQKQRFRCDLIDDLPLYDYSATLPTLKSLHPQSIDAVLHRFSISDEHQPLSDTIHGIAADLFLEPMQVEKVLLENSLIVINSYRECERVGPKTSGHRLSKLIAQQIPPKLLVDNINSYRSLASQLYHVHERAGAEVIFSSDGTGFGKSYGVIQGYVEYLERFAESQEPDYVFPKGGFTNLLFMSPQKSQIDLDSRQKEKILAAGGELICVLARKDIADLDFMDWASGQKNRVRYKRWYDVAKNSKYIGPAIRTLQYIVSQIDYCEEQIERLTGSSSPEAVFEKEETEKQLKNHRYRLGNTIESACKALFDPDNPGDSIHSYITLGVQVPQKRQKLGLQDKTKDQPKMAMDEVYLEIIKQVLPFEVCKFRPSVLLMTTKKFDTTTYRLVPRQRGEGMRFEPVGFDLLIGGKLKPEEPQISKVADQPHAVKVDYLRNQHFKLNPDCPFRRNNIRFTVVIDELHEAYTRLEESSHVSLVEQENNLAHVISVTRRIHTAVLSLESRSKHAEEQTDFEQESVKFIKALRELLAEKCELSSGTTLDSMLEIFRDQLGAFEVNSDSAERIISITRNVFSFNAKMYVNEEALKRICIRHTDGDITRTEFYYEVADDDSDINPTLHDLFQLVSAILAACAQITNPQFKRWVKNGGQNEASSQNAPLGQFVDAANNVAGEVRHIFDRTTDENLVIDHFYTYLQPKTVFTLTPVAELNYVNKGAERTVILAFEMDLVKELPEALLLRLLTGTDNKVIGLSATSGFSHTKNGNFSRSFLQLYAEDLGYQVVDREPSDISMLRELRELRAKLRDVEFKVFDAELIYLTNTHENCPDFRSVYDDFFHALREPLGDVLNNPYKLRQHKRELEALLLAAYEGKNSLILSLSGGFKSAFARAYRQNQREWRLRYGMHSKCDNEDKRHDQILTFTPFPHRHTIRLVFFDAALANIEDIKQQTYIQDANMVLVFMSTYNSAGTGLNYFVKYHDGGLSNSQVPSLDVDFERLILVNSSFYSEVKDKGTNLNTLPNYVTVLKHLADDEERHLMRELSVNFAQGENYRLLMAEHDMSLFKVIVQAVGRVERRDTFLKTEIFLPSDVMHNTAFQFVGLSESADNEVVLESMSLLNYRLKEYCNQKSQTKSFADSARRRAFEEQMLADGKRIDQTHKRILKQNWINQVRRGQREYLAICNLFRDPDSFKNPEVWLEKLQANAQYASNPHMQAIHGKMFISRVQDNQQILISRKRGSDGLPHKNHWALSDFIGGAQEYRPELTIFPQYSSNVDYRRGNLVRDLIHECKEIQKQAFSKLVPHPAMIPLLKGNVGEYLFDKILSHYGVEPMTEAQVFEHLDSLVYEFFDRFIEVGDELICIDVKRWATKLDNIALAESMVEKNDNKIRQIRNLASQHADQEGKKQVIAALAGRYQRIRFVYLNAAYSQNPNNLMWEDNTDHTVHYLNLLQTDPYYYQPLDREKKRRQDKSKLNTKLDINPMLSVLLGVC